MTLEQVLQKKNFVVMGNTLEAGKPAREIKEKLLSLQYIRDELAAWEAK